MTLHLHIPDDPAIASEAVTARCSDLIAELVMALMAEPDPERRAVLAAASCGTIVEAVTASFPGVLEALRDLAAPPQGPVQ